jgi:hypothetical protein
MLQNNRPLGGKGRLTDTAIEKIQICYGLAVRRNLSSVAAMKEAILAVFLHVSSSNKDCKHIFCPKTSVTWCKYHKAHLEGKTYNHNDHFHLPSTVMAVVKPIFKDLCDPELLKKCLKGKTQNPNESFNNVIWSHIPKRMFVGIRTLDFSVYEAVLEFNNGYISKIHMLEYLGFSAGRYSVKAMKTLDHKRVRRAHKAIAETEKKLRQNRNLARRKLEDYFAGKEDPNKPSYSAGSY